MANLVGQKFNYLTVIEKTSERENGSILWKCKCECGKECFASTRSLHSNNKKSCGCLNNSRRAERFKKYNDENREDIIGNKYNKLTVLEITNKTSSKGTNLYYKCRCECGNEIYVTGNNLKNGQNSCGCLKSKGEEKIIKILLNNDIEFETQKTFDTCRFINTNGVARFDFYLPQYNTLIEYDGKQHFVKESANYFFDNLEDIQKRDEYKNNWCKENNINLIRISYIDFYNFNIYDLLPETSRFIVNKLDTSN